MNMSDDSKISVKHVFGIFWYFVCLLGNFLAQKYPNIRFLKVFCGNLSQTYDFIRFFEKANPKGDFIRTFFEKIHPKIRLYRNFLLKNTSQLGFFMDFFKVGDLPARSSDPNLTVSMVVLRVLGHAASWALEAS